MSLLHSIDTLNKQNVSFFPKMGDRKEKIGPVWGMVPVGGRRI
jgi:hypothetical protein